MRPPLNVFAPRRFYSGFAGISRKISHGHGATVMRVWPPIDPPSVTLKSRATVRDAGHVRLQRPPRNAVNRPENIAGCVALCQHALGRSGCSTRQHATDTYLSASSRRRVSAMGASRFGTYTKLTPMWTAASMKISSNSGLVASALKY